MLTLRRAAERHHVQGRKREVWHTFYALDRSDPLADGFGDLELLDEGRLSPGANGPFASNGDREIVTYVLEGTLAHADTSGRVGVIHAGEFQQRTPARGVLRSELNTSRTVPVHVFHICLRPAQVERTPGHELKRFPAAERRGVLRLVASPDGAHGSLRVQQDSRIYSAMLDPGQHLVHELSAEHAAWLHVVRGEATLGDLVLATGDGAGVIAERAVSITALSGTELLLLDLVGLPATSDEPRWLSKAGSASERMSFAAGPAHTRVASG
jgi:redox-sensitive bicupin YhaK (pirin superfamily)